MKRMIALLVVLASAGMALGLTRGGSQCTNVDKPCMLPSGKSGMCKGVCVGPAERTTSPLIPVHVDLPDTE